MTRAPLVMSKAETAFSTRQHDAHDTTLGWRFTNPRLSSRHTLNSSCDKNVPAFARMDCAAAFTLAIPIHRAG